MPPAAIEVTIVSCTVGGCANLGKAYTLIAQTGICAVQQVCVSTGQPLFLVACLGIAGAGLRCGFIALGFLKPGTRIFDNIKLVMLVHALLATLDLLARYVSRCSAGSLQPGQAIF
jgi:uncharacterized membrane protein